MAKASHRQRPATASSSPHAVATSADRGGRVRDSDQVPPSATPALCESWPSGSPSGDAPSQSRAVLRFGPAWPAVGHPNSHRRLPCRRSFMAVVKIIELVGSSRRVLTTRFSRRWLRPGGRCGTPRRSTSCRLVCVATTSRLALQGERRQLRQRRAVASMPVEGGFEGQPEERVAALRAKQPAAPVRRSARKPIRMRKSARQFAPGTTRQRGTSWI